MEMEKRMHGKRILWLLLAALLALAPIALSQKLQVEEYEIYSPKLSGECTLAAISDLHNSFYGEDQGELADAILAAEADALLLVGDMAENLDSCRGVLTLLETLAGRLPVYYVSGNHECAAGDAELVKIKDALRGAGARVLEGAGETLGEIRIAGADDPAGLYRAEWQAQIDACRARDDVFTLLMSHRPDRVEFYEEGFDLAVCGHAHGGQVRLPPLVDGLWAPNQGWFPAYTSGVYALGEGQMIVSRGLAKGPLPRLFNRPELSIIHLLPAQRQS